MAERWDHRVALNVDQGGPRLWPMEGRGLGLRRTLRRVPALQKNELYTWCLVNEYPGTTVVHLVRVLYFKAPPFAASYSHYKPHRVSWAELREDLHRRKAFRKTTRMSERNFVNFVHLLRPALQKDEH